MKFFNSKIVTKPISLEEAVKKIPTQVRSLDDIIASATQIKTAAAQAEVKTAAVEAPKAEAVKAEAPKTEAKAEVKEAKAEVPSVTVKTAADFVRGPGGNIAMDPKAIVQPEVIELNPAEDMDEINAGFDKMKWDNMPENMDKQLSPEEAKLYFQKQKFNKQPFPVKPNDAADALKQRTPMTKLPPAAKPAPAPGLSTGPAAPAMAPAPAMASSKKTLKMAAALDFRNWDASAVVDAWNQHKTVEACVKNVGDKTSDPQTYCGLLRVAASEAGKIMKTAAAAPKEEKTAAPIYKKIAKLSGEEQSFLREFFSKIYGKEYVDAMLGDY